MTEYYSRKVPGLDLAIFLRQNSIKSVPMYVETRRRKKGWPVQNYMLETYAINNALTI